MVIIRNFTILETKYGLQTDLQFLRDNFEELARVLLRKTLFQ